MSVSDVRSMLSFRGALYHLGDVCAAAGVRGPRDRQMREALRFGRAEYGEDGLYVSAAVLARLVSTSWSWMSARDDVARIIAEREPVLPDPFSDESVSVEAHAACARLGHALFASRGLWLRVDECAALLGDAGADVSVSLVLDALAGVGVTDCGERSLINVEGVAYLANVFLFDPDAKHPVPGGIEVRE